MQVKHSSIEPYIRLLQSMEAELCKVEQEDQENQDGDRYRKAVVVMALGIRELLNLIVTGFANEEEEMAFFREACIFSALSEVLDRQFAIIGRHTAACALAYKRRFDFLQWQNPEVDQRAGKTKGWKFEWKKSRSAAVELIKAQAINESVYVNGRPATAVQLAAKWEEDYGEDLGDFNKLLYAIDARKTEPTIYLTELINGLLGRKKMLRK